MENEQESEETAHMEEGYAAEKEGAGGQREGEERKERAANDGDVQNGAEREMGICLKCGKTAPLYNNLCEDCFRSSVRVSHLPHVLKMKICLKCSYMMNPQTGQRVVEWKEGVKETVENSMEIRKDAHLLSIETTFRERDDYIIDVETEVEAELAGLTFRERHSSEMRLTYGVCNRCSRQYGNYYEALIQLRGGKRPLTEEEIEYAEGLVERKVEESGAENAFISRVESIHKGRDFYLGDRSLGKEIARELHHHFGGEFLETFSLAGRKDGRDVHRATYLVRLSDYRTGDFVLFEERVHRITKVGTKTIALVSLTTGKDTTVKERDYSGIHPIAGDIVEAVVVSALEDEAQLLDPVNYRTVAVLTPHHPLRAGETVKAFRYEERLYLLPESD